MLFRRRTTSLHLLYVHRSSFTSGISALCIRDIATALRAAIDGPNPDRMSKLRDIARKKFKGVQYVNQDGTLTNKGQVDEVESEMGDTHMNILLPFGARWDGEHQPIADRNGQELGFEGVPGEDYLPTQPLEFFPVDFFADPSVLSGPSPTGFTGMGDHRTAGEGTNFFFSDDYDPQQFFCGEGSQAPVMR